MAECKVCSVFDARDLMNTDPDFLSRMAGCYVWGKTPEEAVTMPYRGLAQVMDSGTWEDIVFMLRTVDA